MQYNKDISKLTDKFKKTGPIRVLAFIEAKEEKRQELLNILISIIEPSRKEEGNIEYNLYLSIDNPNEIMFDELWSSKETFDKHYNSIQSQENRKKIKDMLIKPMEIKLFKETEQQQI